MNIRKRSSVFSSRRQRRYQIALVVLVWASLSIAAICIASALAAVMRSVG